MAPDMDFSPCALRAGWSVRKRTYAARQEAHSSPVKHWTLQAPGAERDHGSASDLSAEASVQREIVKLGEWLAAQGLDLQTDHAHADEGSRDRLYLRYGYFMGLQNALALLTDRGQTLH